MRRYSGHGINLETGATKYSRALIANNVFDADPYIEHSNRTAGPDGTWNSGAQQPTAVDYVNFKGVTIAGNSFRNLNQVVHSNGNSLGSFSSNLYFMEPAAGFLFTSYGTTNKGIRNPAGINLDGILVWEDSTPTSATYGQELGRSGAISTAGSIPTSGYYVGGSLSAITRHSGLERRRWAGSG
jgi:hypothetical protein